MADTLNAIQKRVARPGPWFHNITLPDGTQTAPAHCAGNDFPREMYVRGPEHPSCVTT